MRVIFFICVLLLTSQAVAQCRHALILAIDISASVTWKEYRMQQRSLAAALRDPDVVDLILSDPDQPISILAFEWAGNQSQTLSSDWIELSDVSQIELLAQRIENFTNDRSTYRTAIGQALQFSKFQFERGPDCARRTIDVSTDGKNNVVPKPDAVYLAGGFEDIVVNTLSIGEENVVPGAEVKNRNLLAYHRRFVNHGIGSFTIQAEGFSDYQRAMKRKLIRELSPLALSQLDYGWYPLR
ncbi:MAG: DUF1194 domain-containing protein [Pseudomonadota bacterium]